MSGFEVGGVDTAIARRHAYFDSLDCEIKYFFQKCPELRDVNLYMDMGIPLENMIYLEAAYSGMENLSGNVSTKEKVDELVHSFGVDSIQYNKGEIFLFRAGEIVAQIWTMNDGAAIYVILFYSNGKIVSREVYWGRHLFTDLYLSLEDGTECCDRYYYDNDGKLCLEVHNEGSEKENFILASGCNCNRYELFEEFFKKANISERDVSIIDRPSFMDYIQPIFSCCKSRKVVFLHSLHYMLPNESITGLYVNNEYYNYFKNSEKVDCFVVSSEAQKNDLERHLVEYGNGKSRIEVIPVVGIAEIKMADEERIPYSIITASRFELGKQIAFLVRAVIKAHEKNSNIHLDIYGDGAEAPNIRRVIDDHSAWDYISLKGFCKVTELYKRYEVFATMSAYETYGISLLEAISSGNAVIGLNVRYGNKMFIRDGINGYILDFDLNNKNDEKYMLRLADDYAEKIVEMFSDIDKLRDFQKNSYALSEEFSDEAVKMKWVKLINEFVN